MTETSKVKPPFEVGDAVKLRVATLALRKFRKMIANDVGIVVNVKLSDVKSDCWLVTVHWQLYSNPANGKKEASYYHTRFKHAVRKKKVKNEE